MGKKCKVKLDVGTVYQKEEGGTYYFRYQVQHERKCVSLKTSNQEEALEKARKLLPISQLRCTFYRIITNVNDFSNRNKCRSFN